MVVSQAAHHQNHNNTNNNCQQNGGSNDLHNNNINGLMKTPQQQAETKANTATNNTLATNNPNEPGGDVIAASAVPVGDNGDGVPVDGAAAVAVVEEEEGDAPEIDIVINNVVCSFSVRCHLNLRDIALNGHNVEFRRENGMVTMKLRKPYTTASMWSSGKITCTGATSEDQVSENSDFFLHI